MTLILNGTDNSATVPAVTGTDTDTGIYYPTSNQVAIATNGTQAMLVDSSQNVGIGTASPAGKLDARGDVYLGSTSAGNTTYVRTTANWNYTGLNVIRNSSNSSTTKGIEFLYDGDSAGNTTIGGTNAIWTFANASPTTGSTTSGLQSGLTYGAYYGHRWNVNGTEYMRIDSGGTWMLNTTDVDAFISSSTSQTGYSFRPGLGPRLSLVNDFYINRSNGDGTIFNFRRNGTTVGSVSVSSGATAYNTSSDYRLKQDIISMTGALAKVAALKPVTYKWKSDGSDAEGFIAHELAEVCPHAETGEKDAVDEDGNPVYQGIDVSFLVATLTAAIQELKAEFDAYKATHP